MAVGGGPWKGGDVDVEEEGDGMVEWRVEERPWGWRGVVVAVNEGGWENGGVGREDGGDDGGDGGREWWGGRWSKEEKGGRGGEVKR